jgi:cytochrome o ubiquinol oxidase operon protein cyoD
MTEHKRIVVSHHQPGRPALRLYVTGYVLSLYLTIMAYFLVSQRIFSRQTLILAAVGLALTQFVVQLIFFLHLGTETRPRWKLIVFMFMITIVMILVFGSLWIMSNLNYRMTPQQINTYMKNQDGL